MKKENLVGVFDMKRGYVTAVYQYWPHPDDIYNLGPTLDPRGHQPVDTRLWATGNSTREVELQLVAFIFCLFIVI